MAEILIVLAKLFATAPMPNQRNTSVKLEAYGYSNSDWGGDQDDRKSTA
ncbi:hypothetical protein A2U01_0099171, partial [Trifolium medium]|nr:hypothetical protein [Trifolium medium]